MALFFFSLLGFFQAENRLAIVAHRKNKSFKLPAGAVEGSSLLYAWEAAWGKVLTLDKLQRRGWQLRNRCNLCGCVEETVHHILLHYPIVSSLWEIIFTLVGVHWVFPKTV